MILINGVYFFSLYLCIVILVINYAKAIRFTEVLYASSISNAAIKIVSEFYKPRTSNVFLSYGCFNAKNDKTLTDIVDNVIVRTSSDVSYIIEEKINNNTINNVRLYNIMFVDSYAGFS